MHRRYEDEAPYPIWRQCRRHQDDCASVRGAQQVARAYAHRIEKSQQTSRAGSEAAVETSEVVAGPDLKANGHKTGNGRPVSAELSVILASLQTMRDGDFSVRLPGSWTGLAGKIADTFNDIVGANQQMAQELNRVGQVVGKEGRTRERTQEIVAAR